jgi:hypothetical protein
MLAGRGQRKGEEEREGLKEGFLAAPACAGRLGMTELRVCSELR